MTRAAPTRRRSPRGGGEQLREDIVEAVKQLLRETDDVDAISIRAVAQRVGVTAPSIYLHFADKEALLDAVVADVFAGLDAAISAATARSTTPVACVLAQGLAYVQFAVDHREHYRVALMQPSNDTAVVDDVLRDCAFAYLHRAVEECIEGGFFADTDPLPIALELWSAAHGVASLVIAKPQLPWGDVEAFARSALNAALLGHLVDGLFDEDDDYAAVAAWARKRRNALR
jgi:AcrR family transcriptional regulator